MVIQLPNLTCKVYLLFTQGDISILLHWHHKPFSNDKIKLLYMYLF